MTRKLSGSRSAASIKARIPDDTMQPYYQAHSDDVPPNPRTRGRGSKRWNRLAGTGSRELLGEHLEQGGDDLGVELAALRA